MIQALKKVSGISDHTSYKGYFIIKYWHPSSGKRPEWVQNCKSLEEAQEICSKEESSFKEGDESNWWFLGYTEQNSRFHNITLW